MPDMNTRPPRLSPIGPNLAFAIMTVLAAAGCHGTTTTDTDDPGDPPAVGQSDDPECPKDEPRTLDSCVTDGKICTYSVDACSRDRVCRSGVWSFESEKCNY